MAIFMRQNVVFAKLVKLGHTTGAPSKRAQFAPKFLVAVLFRVAILQAEK